MIFGSFETRIALGESVALFKSFVEPSAISFLCPPINSYHEAKSIVNM